MTQQTYHVTFHFPVPICDGWKARNQETDTLQTAQQLLAWRKERDARKWLTNHGHEPPLIVYDNCKLDSTQGEIVVVLHNRDTALLLKLALA